MAIHRGFHECPCQGEGRQLRRTLRAPGAHMAAVCITMWLSTLVCWALKSNFITWACAATGTIELLCKDGGCHATCGCSQVVLLYTRITCLLQDATSIPRCTWLWTNVVSGMIGNTGGKPCCTTNAEMTNKPLRGTALCTTSLGAQPGDPTTTWRYTNQRTPHSMQTDQHHVLHNEWHTSKNQHIT